MLIIYFFKVIKIIGLFAEISLILYTLVDNYFSIYEVLYVFSIQFEVPLIKPLQ